MNLKMALLGSAAVIAAALAGCGADECMQAEDTKAQCLQQKAATSTGATATEIQAPYYECTGSYLCQSKCVNASTCALISMADAKYVACIEACAKQYPQK